MTDSSPYFVHKALYERALGLKDMLSRANSGFRIFCTEDRFATALFAPDRVWPRYGPIYLTDGAATAVGSPSSDAYHFEPLSEELHILLDNCWHVIGQFTHKPCWFGVQDTEKIARVVAAPISPHPKINLIVGRLNSGEPLFATVDQLQTELLLHVTDFAETSPQTSDLASIAFDYLDREVLAKCHFDELPYPSLSLPSHNFDNPIYDTDAPTRPEHKLMEVLEDVVLGKRLQDLLTALASKHVLFIGGFGAGSDVLAKHLLLEAANQKDDNGLLTMECCGGVDGAQRMLELAESDAMMYGSATIFRDLFDPQISLWIADSGGYKEERGGLFSPELKAKRVAKVVHGLPDDSRLGRLVARVKGSPRNTCYLIFTTQYDSLQHLATAIGLESRAWNGALRENVEHFILRTFGECFVGAADGITTNHLDEMAHSIMRRWVTSGRSEPAWFRDRNRLYEYAVVAEMYRPALWCRMLWHLLLCTSEQVGVDSVASLARHINQNAYNQWLRLHQPESI